MRGKLRARCFICGAWREYVDSSCPKCGKSPNWTDSPLDAALGTALRRRRQRGELTTTQAAAAFRWRARRWFRRVRCSREPLG